MKARLAATLLGILFFLCVLILHGPHFSAILHNGTDRTRALEPLSLCAAAWVLAGTLANERSSSTGWEIFTDKLASAGRCIFAATMIVFGIQHFMNASFIAFLVPPWLPAHLFWAYFTGVGFIVAAVAILINVCARLAATWLGIMFLLWFIILHAPRVAAAVHNADEWTSAFVALAMGGASFIVPEGVRCKNERSE